MLTFFSWFVGKYEDKKITCNKTQTKPNLRFPISSGNWRGELPAVISLSQLPIRNQRSWVAPRKRARPELLRERRERPPRGEQPDKDGKMGDIT